MNWIKENWFKLSLLIVIALFLFGYLYVQMKESDNRVFRDAYNVCQDLEVGGRLKMIECFDQFRGLMFFRSENTIWNLPDVPEINIE